MKLDSINFSHDPISLALAMSIRYRIAILVHSIPYSVNPEYVLVSHRSDSRERGTGHRTTLKHPEPQHLWLFLPRHIRAAHPPMLQ